MNFDPFQCCNRMSWVCEWQCRSQTIFRLHHSHANLLNAISCIFISYIRYIPCIYMTYTKVMRHGNLLLYRDAMDVGTTLNGRTYDGITGEQLNSTHKTCFTERQDMQCIYSVYTMYITMMTLRGKAKSKCCIAALKALLLVHFFRAL